jgi:hypothetical protein
MQAFLDHVRAQPSMTQVRESLPRIVALPPVHARMINSLARMEYVGVRKMLKARHAAELDLEGLQHVLEEASHALRLKRAAIKLNGGVEHGVRTFGAADTLAGDGAEDYLQGVDRACEALLDRVLAGEQPMEESARTELNYLLSSVIIEIRADAFYPVYEEALQAAGAPFSVRSILKDEERHLAEMLAGLEARFPGSWRELIAEALVDEEACFDSWANVMAKAAEEAAASLEAAS